MGATSHTADMGPCGLAGRGMGTGHPGALFLQGGVLNLLKFFGKEWIQGQIWGLSWCFKELFTWKEHNLSSEWFSDVNNRLVSGITRESSSNLS